jgi:hypothetical protein
MAIELRRPVPSAPIHPLAAFAIIVLDGFFALFEVLDPLLLVGTSLTIGFLGFLATTLVQRFLSKDDWGASVAKGVVMGIVAGVPYPVVGTAVGAPLLIWAGLHQWIKLPPRKEPEMLEDKEEQ